MGDGLPGLAMRVQEDPNFGLARQIIGWRDHARTIEILDFLLFRLVTGSQACHCLCRRIPISAWLDKLSAGGTMPAQ